jgi:hypothetical protein
MADHETQIEEMGNTYNISMRKAKEMRQFGRLSRSEEWKEYYTGP